MKNGNRVLSRITSLIHFLDKWLYFIFDKICIVCYTTMVISVLVGVVMRFAIREPNPYGEEISRYAMILSVFLGIGMVERNNGNIKVDILANALPLKARAVVIIVARFIAVASYVFMAVVAWQYVARISETSQVSTCLRIPMYIVYAFMFIGFAFAAFYSFVDFWKTFIDKQEEEEETLFYN